MKYAVETGLREDNPAIGVKLPNLKTEAYHNWTEAEIEKFRAYHEIAAITGHAGLSEVQRYTKAVDQVRLARAAMGKAK